MRDLLRNALLGLALLLVPGIVSAQVGTIQGRVIESGTNISVPGVNVTLEGTNLGTATDLDGNYSFVAPAGSYTLVVSAIGYRRSTQSVTVQEDQTTIVNISIEQDVLGLDDVVVTGTGAATSRRQVAIDVASVSGDQLAPAVTPSLDQALAGKIAGAQITQTGQPGAPSQIILRGINTLGNTTPLILIDGVAINTDVLGNGGNLGSSRLGDIDFNDIERIEVVKGAAAAGLYGAQGANGVIQLFTRSGQAGAPRVTINSSIGFSEFTRGGVEYSTLHSYPVDANGNIANLEVNADGNWTNVSQRSVAGAITRYEYQLNGQPLQTYDNLDVLFRSAANTNNSVSISGGTQRLTYLVSGSAVRQQGVEEAVGFWRNSFRLNLGSQLLSNFRIDARVNLINSQNQGETVQGNSVNSQIGSALVIPRYIDVLSVDPNTNMYRGQHHIGQTANSPLFYKQINDRNAELVRIIQSTSLNYTPFSFLDLNYTLGIDHYRNQYTERQMNVQGLTAAQRGPVLTPEGSLGITNAKASNLTSNATGFLRTTLPVGFPVASTTQLTYEWRKDLYQSVYAGGTGLSPIPGLITINAISDRDASESRSTFITYGFLINQKFDIGQWGGIEGGVRQDYSSAFQEGEGAELFPRGAVYFRPVEFLSPGMRNTVTELKLRAAYGSAGTQPGAYSRIQTLSQGTIGSGPYAGTLFTPTTLANPLLGVERSSEAEVGLDLGLRLGRSFFSTLGANATLWSRSSDDVIYSIGIAPSTGSSNQNTNAFTIASSGFDLSVNSLVFYNRNFSWNTTLNFGKQTSEVESISNGEDVTINVQSGQTFILREGEDVGAHFGVRAVKSFDEINPATGNRYVPEGSEHLWAFVDGALVNVATQRVLFRSNQEVIGNATPDFTLGFRNDFTISRNLSFGIQFDWVQGADVYNATRQRMYQYNMHADNQEPILIQGSAADPSTGNPRLPVDIDTGEPVNAPAAWASYYNSLYNTNVKNEYFVEDGSFLKLRELSISYDFSGLVRQVLPSGISRLALNFTGRNLLTFTKYKGFDPEVNQGGVSSLTRGYDYNSYPNFRTYTVGISTTF